MVIIRVLVALPLSEPGEEKISTIEQGISNDEVKENKTIRDNPCNQSLFLCLNRGEGQTLARQIRLTFSSAFACAPAWKNARSDRVFLELFVPASRFFGSTFSFKRKSDNKTQSSNHEMRKTRL